ncbi:MAG: DUF1194 domain-containing protein [Pseudomonadota bacterium]
MIRTLGAALALSAAFGATPAPAYAFQCHTALVLALDASDSVDPVEADLQRSGIAGALLDPEVMEALAPSEGFGALLMAFEWADPGETQIIAPWTILDSPAAIHAFAAKLGQLPSVYMSGQTGLGAALEFAAKAHGEAPAACARRVIDVSGDGPGNTGPTPGLYRKAGLFDGITINGLVIRQDPDDYSLQQPTRDPLPYYEAEVRHGAGAFVMVTKSYEDYQDALRRKLLRELRPVLAEVAE